MATRYSVYCTPKLSATVYGTEIEITDYVLSSGLKTITKSIDSEDYDVGTFTYDDIEIKLHNVNGKFNEYTDLRSIFTFKRDLAKFRVMIERDGSTDVISYQGLLNEEATKFDVSKEEISFRILSYDSVIRKTMISGGSIGNGLSFSNAFIAIFNDTTIASVLTLAPGDISLPYNGTVDDGAWFDNKSARDGINGLLQASGAVMLVDSNGNVTIQDRTQNLATDILNLYGPFDIKRRQNVIQLKDYNTGLHRMYNSVTVNTTESNNNDYVSTFGFKGKTFDLGFITDPAQELLIADTILDEFKAPKVECVVEIPLNVSQGIDLLDRVSIDWPLRITPYAAGVFMPIVGATKIGEAAMPLPNKYGSIAIEPRIAFKVIEIQEDPVKFSAFLKLRQIGNAIDDGYFTDAGSSIIGYAIIGISTIGGTGTGLDMWNPSVIGAAKIGSTEVTA